MRERRALFLVGLMSQLTLSGCGWAAIVGATAAAGGGGGGGGGGDTTVVQADTVPQTTAPTVVENADAGRALDLEAVTINFNLIESTSEAADVSVEFSLDGCNNFQPINTASPLTGLATSPQGTTQSVVWNAAANGLTGLNTVSLRVTPRDSTGIGQPQMTADIDIGNDPPEVREISLGNVQPATGNLVVRYMLSDSSADICSITAQYRIDGGMWKDITGQEALNGFPW